ncbi:MAG: hypothetical protein ACPH9N_06600, partial [Alteromonas sp.]
MQNGKGSKLSLFFGLCRPDELHRNYYFYVAMSVFCERLKPQHEEQKVCNTNASKACKIFIRCSEFQFKLNVCIMPFLATGHYQTLTAKRTQTKNSLVWQQQTNSGSSEIFVWPNNV